MSARAGAGAGEGVFARHAPVLLVWSCLVLLPFGRAVEAAVLVMAAAGLALLARERTRLLERPGARTLCLVFAAMWLPIVASLPDAAFPERTAVVALNHLRFLLAGLFVCHALAGDGACERLLALSAWLLAAWIADAGVQAVLGVDLLGQAPRGERITGLFGADSLKLGSSVGVLAPALWAFAQQRWPPWALAAALAASAWLVMAAAVRAAWVSLLVCAALFAWASRERIRRLGWRRLLAGAVLAAAVPVASYLLVPAFQARLDESARELTGAEAVESSPLGHRAWIAKGALAMFAAHPVNGVGARGFRYAFPAHAAPGDPFVAQTPPLYPTHSHHVLLEVAAETGLLGLAGLGLAVVVLVRAARRAGPAGRARAAPWGIGLGAAFFPLNTHPALYSSYWSQLVWWLVAVCCACLEARRPRDDAA